MFTTYFLRKRVLVHCSTALRVVTIEFHTELKYAHLVFSVTILCMPRGIAAIVPCFNVGSACVPVVRACSRNLDLCIVIDDGSTDDTARQVESLGASNCRTICHGKNLGKGSALITGFRHILREQPQIDAVVTLDGDGQHDPVFISEFADQFRQKKIDLIYGNRMSQPDGMPKHRRILNAIANGLVSHVCRCLIHDSQCGYRLYSRRLLCSVIEDLKTTRYEMETEILILACKRNFHVGFVPITSIYSAETTTLSRNDYPGHLRSPRFHFSQNSSINGVRNN